MSAVLNEIGRRIGTVWNDVTEAEEAAGVTPTNYQYSQFWVRRYGAVLDGVTSDSTAFASALAVVGNERGTITVDGPMYLASNVTIPANVDIQFLGTGALVVPNAVTVTYNGTVSCQPNNRGASTYTGIFQLAGTGVVTFAASSKQSFFYPEWWGAVGNASNNDYTALAASALQASNAQGRLIITGAYRFDTSLSMQPNIEIVGYGKTFGSSLNPHNCSITFDGNAFRCKIANLTIDCTDTTATNVVDIGTSGTPYNITLEDVFLYNFNTQAANTCGINAINCNDLTLSRVSVYGIGAAATDGIKLGNGVRAKLYSVDSEFSFRCITVTGTAQVDIFSAYCERHAGYGIYIDRAGDGHCNVFGGHFDNPNSGTDGIGIGAAAENVTIIGPSFALNGGKGIEALGSTVLSNVNVIGVPLSDITDTSNVLGVMRQSGGALELIDGITAPSTIASNVQIYVDTADGDLKVKFGDGTIKTIVVDT